MGHEKSALSDLQEQLALEEASLGVTASGNMFLLVVEARWKTVCIVATPASNEAVCNPGWKAIGGSRHMDRGT
jgi:hypothetical protein